LERCSPAILHTSLALPAPEEPQEEPTTNWKKRTPLSTLYVEMRNRMGIDDNTGGPA